MPTFDQLRFLYHNKISLPSYPPGRSLSAPSSKKSTGERVKPSGHDRQKISFQILAQPTMAAYQICGGNGGHIVDAHLSSLGWRKIADKQNFNWKLKWVEVNSQVNYGAFRDGEQLVNRIPNCSLLTNKLGLFNSLSEYSRVMGALKGDRVRLKMGDFIPETYRIDNTKDRDTFLDVYKDGQIWICKPVGLNQGKGIFLIRSREQIDKMLADREQRKQNRRTKPLMALIIQRYIERPLLLEKKKFDIRTYMLVASTVPFVVLYRSGYVRVTCEEYNLDSLDLTTHLTNQFVQKKHEDYKEVKEDTVWSMQKMNEYVNENFKDEKGIEHDWVLNAFEKQIKSIMKFCFNSVKHKLTSRLGLFDLYGLDFMIDENMKIYLIEINVNPAMHVNCDVLKETIPPILQETVDLALECFEKTKKNQPILPLQSLRTFQILHNACPKSSSGQGPTQGQSNASDSQTNTNTSTSTANHSPVRSSQSPSRSQPARRSSSPAKEQSWGYISRAPLKSSKSQSNAETEAKTVPTSSVKTSGTNFIKSNIANLSNLANVAIRNRNPSLPSSYSHRSGRLSRLDTKPEAKLDSNTEKKEETNQSEANTQTDDLVADDSQSKLIKEEEPMEQQQEQDEPAETALYNKQTTNMAPMTTQQIAARARGTNSTATVQGITRHISPEWKTTEHLLQELKDHQPKIPLLPPLYTLKSDVGTSRNTQNHLQSAISDQPISLQGYPAISHGNEQLNSPVRLSMVHAAYAPSKIQTKVGNLSTTPKRYSRDRAS